MRNLTWVTYTLPSCMIEVREYTDANGNCPYAKWFDGLNAQAAARAAIAVTRMEQGNLSNTKSVGAGVL